METHFSDQVMRHFGFLQEGYGFWGAEETFHSNHGVSRKLLVESDRYSLEFFAQGQRPQVTIQVGRVGQPRVELAWVFTYLTRGTLPGAAPWLYYFPTYPLCHTSNDSINWQMERLAEILHPMWPAIFIFLDMDGHRSAEFLAYIDRAGRANAEQDDDGYTNLNGSTGAREVLGFPEKVEKSFAYLRAYQYKRIHSDPLLVRYELSQNQLPNLPPVYINVFHRKRSYQVGVHVGWRQENPEDEINFDMGELASWSGQVYQLPVATKAPELSNVLNHVARQFRRFAAPLLAGDVRLLDALQTRRVDAARRTSRAWAERNR